MLSKLLSTQLKDTSIHIGLFLLRLTAGCLMIPHGYDKLMTFSENKNDFMNFMGLGSPVSLALVIGAEFFCAILITGGLLTRLATLPLLITMAVAVFDIHEMDIFGEAGTAFIYLMMYTILLITGPGKFSLDAMVLKK